LEKYYLQYKSLPTRTVVEHELSTDKSLDLLVEEQHFVPEFLALLSADFITESLYIKETFKSFAKSKAINDVLREYADDAVKTGNFDELQSNLRNKSRDFIEKKYADESTFSLLNLEEIYTNRNGIKTGIKLIDNAIGGLMGKELSLLLGDTNVGKSLLATCIGAHAVKQMRKVLHVGLEMSRARNLIRYYTSLADPEDKINYGQIFNYSPEDHVFDYVNTKLRDQYEGYLFVEEFPTGKCSIEDLYRLLDKHSGIELLIVDYMDLMKAITKRKEIRFELSDMAGALRGLAGEADNLHVMSPTQASKLAKNKRIVGTQYSAEDYGKMRIADWAIGIGQNDNDILKNQVVLSIARSRNSAKGLAERYVIDFNSMKFIYHMQEVMGGAQDGH
jgi:hypothetical protein